MDASGIIFPLYLETPLAALNLLYELEGAVSRLKQNPFLGSMLSDECLAAKGYRKLVVENDLIFWLANEILRGVAIMRVIYGAREYRELP